MVLNYLLAEEGGVCGKLNDSNCCLKISGSGKIVKQMTTGIRKLAHVPVQTWKGWDVDCFPGSLVVHGLSKSYFICYVVLPC